MFVYLFLMKIPPCSTLFGNCSFINFEDLRWKISKKLLRVGFEAVFVNFLVINCHLEINLPYNVRITYLMSENIGEFSTLIDYWDQLDPCSFINSCKKCQAVRLFKPVRLFGT